MPAARNTMSVRRVSADASIIDIQGDVSAFSEQALWDAYAQATTSTTRVILLNFGSMEYMNSSGVGLLVVLLTRMRRQKQRLVAFGLSDHYRHIFHLTRLEHAITLFAGEAEALAALGVASAASAEQPCAHCGALMPGYARFCGRCGMPLPPGPQESSMSRG